MTKENTILLKSKNPINTSELWEIGSTSGQIIAESVLGEFPNFPEGVKKEPNSEKTHEEMLVSYCIWKFHERSPDAYSHLKMNEFYQANREIGYSQICEAVNEGLKEGALIFWNQRFEIREIPVIKNEYPL